MALQPLRDGESTAVRSISVVIPAYNAERYIASTLESVLQQTLSPQEVIVVDDGSIDKTAEIAESFGPTVTVFRIPNGRLSAARNLGVDEAKGEWIAFVDADDLWMPNKLELQMLQLSKHPEADLCYTGMRWLWQKGDETVLGKEHTFVPPENIRQELLRDVCFLPSTVMIRRSTFLEMGGFDPLIVRNEDHGFWLRLREAQKKFTACSQPLLQYRRHDSNTGKGREWFEEAIALFKRRVYPELPPLTRSLRFASYRSDHEADLAYTLRMQQDPECLHYMALSLLHRPFHEPIRYKVFAHMIYSRLRGRV